MDVLHRHACGIGRRVARGRRSTVQLSDRDRKTIECGRVRTSFRRSTHRSHASWICVARSSYSCDLQLNPEHRTLSIPTSPNDGAAVPFPFSVSSCMRALTQPTHSLSLGETKHHASPPLPARAVRPILWTYSVAPPSVGRSA